MLASLPSSFDLPLLFTSFPSLIYLHAWSFSSTCYMWQWMNCMATCKLTLFYIRTRIPLWHISNNMKNWCWACNSNNNAICCTCNNDNTICCIRWWKNNINKKFVPTIWTTFWKSCGSPFHHLWAHWSYCLIVSFAFNCFWCIYMTHWRRGHWDWD